MKQSVAKASGSGLTEELPKEEERAAKEIHLTGDKHKVSELPESPNCTSSIALYLQGNDELIAIPPLFFLHMPCLQVLDLSGTSIKSLPKSLPKLVALKKLLLRSCKLFMELSPEVGKLENLEELNLDETQIMDLPREIGKLLKLRHLRVAFYHVCGKKKSNWNILIDPATISILSQLTELCLDVNPEDKRWDDCVEAVLKEVCNSKTLKTLSLYLPQFQLLDYTAIIYSSLSRFSFTVGNHKRRIISRVPHEVEAEFRNWDKCLKFVNGEKIPIEIIEVLKYSTSFFLDHHATAMNLSEFGIENMKRLKFCLLAESNKMETLIDGEMNYGRNEHVLESLEYLSIYYMENLGSIWRGANHYGCMSKLKFLALHTCPKLNIIFSHTWLENFVNLEEFILEDCPQVTSLVSHASVKPIMSGKIFLPSLKRLLLLYLPELVSISNGLLIAPKLESLGCYNCPKLKSISKMELSSKTLKIIKGECQWWEDMNWNETEWGNRPNNLMRIFSPIDNEKDVMTQLAEDRDLLEAPIENEGQQSDSFNLLVNNGAAAGQVHSLHRRPQKLDSETSSVANLKLKQHKDDQGLNMMKLFKKNHYLENKGWLTPECQIVYKKMEELNSNIVEEGTEPKTVDVILDEMLGTKSRYIKGLGYKPKPTTEISSDAAAERRARINNSHTRYMAARRAQKKLKTRKNALIDAKIQVPISQFSEKFPIDNEKNVMTQLAEDRDLLEATIENERQQSDDEKLLEVSAQDHKGQYSGYTKERTIETDVIRMLSTPLVSLLPSTPGLGISEVLQSSPSKRARATNNGTQQVSCLVDECNSDLSKCRDCHRRHKVCELHSRTAQVMINVQKQRFCQQCSRNFGITFHSLEEFDEGKRICRKCLDWHNRRTRKPQSDPFSRSGSYFSNYQGTQMLPFSSLHVYPSTTVVKPTWPGVTNSETESRHLNQQQLLHSPEKQNLVLGSSSSNYRGGKQFTFLQGENKTLQNQTPSEASVCQPLLRAAPFSEGSVVRHNMFCDSLTTPVQDWDRALSLLSSPQTETSGIRLSNMMQPHSFPLVQPLGPSLQNHIIEPIDSVVVADGRDTTVHCPGMLHMGSVGSSGNEAPQTIPFH